MEPPQTDGADVGLVSRSVRVEPAPVRAFFAAAESPRTVWSAPDEATVVGSGAAATLAAAGSDRFQPIREAAEDLFASGSVHAGTEAARPRLFGGFAFHENVPGERGDSPWRAFPGARFVLPRVQLTESAAGTWLTVNAAGPDATPAAVESRLDRERERLAGLPDNGPVVDPPGVAARTRTTDLDAWHESVTAAVERIRSGELRKVVLAQALACDLESDLSPGEILARLGRRYPDCHRFLVEPDSDRAGADGVEVADGPRAADGAEVSDAPDASPADGDAPARNGDRTDADRPPAFFGATPERLVSRRGRTVETGALAGTTGRGDTPAEDEWLAEELRTSEKNVHEHELVADAIRDQLAPYASSVSTGDRAVRRFATVQHLWTPITATLADDEHVLELVEALHPTPAVGGLPPGRALETIRETEPFDRGWYAAPVGWFDAAGNGTFAVAIRSALATHRRATLFAGVGIVADSDPDREWDEVQLKYRPILDELERG